jgi:pimeloyl-ACP methyl ester carboxylesterase
MKKHILHFFLLILLISCKKNEFNISTNTDDFFFLRNNGADMPVNVKGNTASKTFILILHGGPGGSALMIEELFHKFTKPLENNYGVVYWDQRSSGATQGNYNTIKIEHFIDDLEKLITLIKNKYGNEVEIHLMGISWGGYLGTAYLNKDDNQKNIKSWINIVGPNSFLKMANIGKDKLLYYAQQKLALGKNEEDWKEIKEWCLKHDSITNTEDFLEENRFANYADLLMADSIDNQIETASVKDQLRLIYNSPFSSGAWSSNMKGIKNSDLISQILQNDLSCTKISIPSLFVGGRFDFVVPEEILQDQFAQVNTSNKEIHIFEKSGHGVIAHEVDKLNIVIVEFIERIK